MTEQQSRSSEWLAWMNDYVDAARRFISEDPVDVASDEERELIALKMALYARALTLFEGALLLLENDRQLDFRIHSRGVLEATMYLIALGRNPAFVAKMKDDDFKSRHSRGPLFISMRRLSAEPTTSGNSCSNSSIKASRARRQSNSVRFWRAATSIGFTAAIAIFPGTRLT